jgi:hypothetical protein
MSRIVILIYTVHFICAEGSHPLNVNVSKSDLIQYSVHTLVSFVRIIINIIIINILYNIHNIINYNEITNNFYSSGSSS